MKKFLAITFAVAMIMSISGATSAAEPQVCSRVTQKCYEKY